MAVRFKKQIKGMFQGDIRVVTWEKYRLLYVRIPKSGNSSIRESIEGAEKGRMSSTEILRLGDDWTSFSFVRNPWSRLVSTFRHKASMDSSSPRMEDGVYQGFLDHSIPVRADMTFEEFCEVVCAVPHHKTDKHLRSQSSFLMLKDQPIVSFIGKVEKMEQDWRKLMDQVGLDIEISHLNKTSHCHYSNYFTDKSLIKLVGDYYADDIRYFNYEFETG